MSKILGMISPNELRLSNSVTGEKIILDFIHGADFSFNKDNGVSLVVTSELINDNFIKLIKDGIYNVELSGKTRDTEGNDSNLLVSFTKASVTNFRIRGVYEGVCRFNIIMKTIDDNFDFKIVDEDNNIIIEC